MTFVFRFIFRFISVLFLAGCAALAEEAASPEKKPYSIRPGAFFSLIGEGRSATTGDTINTRLGAFPLRATDPEYLISPVHSRTWLHTEFEWKCVKSLTFLEQDFLQPRGRAPFRWRQYWTQLAWGKWTLMGGQGWSLLRPNRTGTSSESGLMNTDTVEPAYHVGLAGFRRKQLRLTRELSPESQAALEWESNGKWIAKYAHDRKGLHWEIAGLAGTRGRKAVSLAGVVPVGRGVKWVSQAMLSDGEGPDELGLIPGGVMANSTIQGVEWKIGASEIYSYGGMAYGGRSTGNRVVREWTVGGRRALFRDFKPGKFMMGVQLSQIDRSPWRGGHGDLTYGMAELRYTINPPR